MVQFVWPGKRNLWTDAQLLTHSKQRTRRTPVATSMPWNVPSSVQINNMG